MKKNSSQKKLETATFAGGCFWCVEAAFIVMPGVIKVVSGYAGGKEKNPTYEQVSSGMTGHVEAIQITYDKKKISYQQLLDFFWKQIDPTDSQGQFVDRGSQYRPVIFYHSEKQKKLALASKKKLEASKKFDSPIVVEIVPFKTFFLAEDYHQEYYKKNPLRYNMYKMGSGRNARLKEIWE
jgi:methionine-S-sulfoxide reductase